MAVLIDSSVFIDVERRGLPPRQVLALVAGEEAALASMTASELLAGVLRADTPERRVRREAFVEAILEFVPTLPFDLRVARVHAHLWAQLRAEGTSIGTHDLQIAATALGYGYDLLTGNLREFGRVPGLGVRPMHW